MVVNKSIWYEKYLFILVCKFDKNSINDVKIDKSKQLDSKKFTVS